MSKRKSLSGYAKNAFTGEEFEPTWEGIPDWAKQGIPHPPKREDYDDDDSFFEAGQEHANRYGRILMIRVQYFKPPTAE